VPSPHADDFFDTPSLFTSSAWYIARVGPRGRSSELTSVEQTDSPKRAFDAPVEPPKRILGQVCFHFDVVGFSKMTLFARLLGLVSPAGRRGPVIHATKVHKSVSRGSATKCFLAFPRQGRAFPTVTRNGPNPVFHSRYGLMV
jgi:hypothetical protein